MSYQKPFYNRYTQSGSDKNGFQTGYPQASPLDTTTGRDQGWKFVEFVPGVGIQAPELNEIQSIIQDQLKDLGDQVRRNGQTTGLQIRVDKTGVQAVVHVEWVDPSVPGKVYADGLFHIVPQTTLIIAAVQTEIVSVKIDREIITAVEDPALYDPTTGTYNSGKEGAYRHAYVVTPLIKNDTNKDTLTGTLDLAVLQDGVIRSNSNDAPNPIDRNLIKYTYDISGDCLVRGMRVKAQDSDALTLLVTVDRGASIVGGNLIEYGTTTPLTSPKSKVDNKQLFSEHIPTASQLIGVSPVPQLQTNYSPSRTPLFQVTKLSLDTIIKKQGLYNGGDPFSQDPSDPLTVIISNNVPYGPISNVISVYDTVNQVFLSFSYAPGKGFRLSAPPAGPIQVIWVYTATLSTPIDYQVSNDRLSFGLQNAYPSALDQTLNTLNPLYGDRASYVYPGVGSTHLAVSTIVGDTTLTLASVDGLIAGQQLYIGVQRDITKDEQVLIKSINVTTNQILLETPVANAHDFSTSYVYNDPGFIGLTLSSSDLAGILDYAYMLDRIDVVYVDAQGNIAIQPGQSNIPAYPPTLPQGVLPLVQMFLPANGDANAVTIKKYPVQRVDQQGMNKILGRMDQLEYNLAQQNLQLTTYNKASATGLQLRSILTDAFVNSNTVEVALNPVPIHHVAIDPDSGTLSPSLTLDNVPLQVDTDPTRTTCFVGVRSATLGFLLTGSPTITNTVATDTETIRSSTNKPVPVVVVNSGHYVGPADRNTTWSFLNVIKGTNEPLPRELEGGFWRTRQNNVPWLAQQQLFLPSLNLTLSGRNFTAGTYTIAIDGKPITGATVVVSASGNFTALPMTVPALSVSGHASRTVSVVDASGAVFASTLYGATPAEAVFLPVAHDSLATSPFTPVAQTFVYPNDKFIGGVNVAFAAKGTSWVEIQVRATAPDGSPSGTVLASKRLDPSLVNTAGLTSVVFDDPVFCPAGQPMVLAFVADQAVDGSQYILKKAVVGHKDPVTQNIVATKPITQGALYVSVDGGGFTVQVDSNLTFTLMECSFRSDKNVLQFQKIASPLLGQIPLLITRAQQLVPRGSVVNWSCVVNGDTLAPISIAIDSDGTLDPQALPKLAMDLTLKATFATDANASNISAQVGVINPRALLFAAKPQGIYVSRAASNVPAYSAARVTLQLLTSLLPVNSVAVKFSTSDDPYGTAQVVLSGMPAYGDKLSASASGIPFTFVYQPTGAPTLLELATQFCSAFTTANPLFTCTTAPSGSSSFTLSFARVSGQALVAGDLVVSALATGTFAAGPVSCNYQVMTRDDTFKQTIDTQFTEYTFGLTGINSTQANPNTPRTFRVQVELDTANPLQYPIIRDLACVVSA